MGTLESYSILYRGIWIGKPEDLVYNNDIVKASNDGYSRVNF